MEKINQIFEKLFEKVPGGVFGLLSVSIGIFIDIMGLSLPGYSIFTHTVSSLGIGPAGLLFNIGLILCGITAIPFEIYLGKSISRDIVNDKVIKTTVAISIISSLSLSLVGFFPINQENDIKMFFHGFFASISFIGGLIYIIIFSLFILKDQRFMKLQAYMGFTVCGFFILYFCTLVPFTEWLAVFSIIIWTIFLSSYMLFKKV